MEQNKLEKHIKEQFNSRTIQPSAQAWDRLDAMLTVAEKPKKRFGWLFIAASFIGFLFMGTYFYTLENQEIQVVEVESGKQKIIQPEKINKDEIAKQKIERLEVKTKTTELTKNQVTEIRNKKITTDETCQTLPKPVLNLKPETQIINNNNSIIEDRKIENPISQQQVTVSEPTLKTKGIKVDASSLLAQVDGELTLTFREKIIKNYKSVKIAIAERNKEN